MKAFHLLCVLTTIPLFSACADQKPTNATASAPANKPDASSVGARDISLVDLGKGMPPRHIVEPLKRHLEGWFGVCDGYPTVRDWSDTFKQFDKLLIGARVQEVGAAENLNGVTWHGLLLVHGSAWRYFDNTQGKLVDWRNVDIENFYRDGVGSFNSVVFNLPARYRNSVWEFEEFAHAMPPKRWQGRCPSAPENSKTESAPNANTQTAVTSEITSARDTPTPTPTDIAIVDKMQTDANVDCTNVALLSAEDQLTCAKVRLRVVVEEMNTSVKTKIASMQDAQRVEYVSAHLEWSQSLMARCKAIGLQAGTGDDAARARIECLTPDIVKRIERIKQS